MASNPSFGNIGGALSKLFGSAAGYNNAQYGNTGFGILDMARPAIDFLTGSYGAHLANPEARGTALAGLGNAVSGLSRRHYQDMMNRQYQNEMEYQRNRQASTDVNNATIFKTRTGIDIEGPFDTDFANQSSGDIRKNRANPWYNAQLHGENADLDPYADYDMDMLKSTLEHFGGVSNFMNRGLGVNAMQDGQRLSLTTPGSTLDKAKRSFGAPGGALSGPQFDSGDGTPGALPGVLPAGISLSRPSVMPDANTSPFFMPTDIPPQISQLLQAGAQDAQQAGQQAITQQNNLANQSLNRDIHNATVQNKGGYARYAPVGPAPQQPTAISAALARYAAGKMTDAELNQVLGAGSGSASLSEDPNFQGLKANLDAATSEYSATKSNDAKQRVQEASVAVQNYIYERQHPEVKAPTSFRRTDIKELTGMLGVNPLIQGIKQTGQDAEQAIRDKAPKPGKYGVVY